MRIGVTGDSSHSQLLVDLLKKKEIDAIKINLNYFDIISNLRNIDIFHLVYCLDKVGTPSIIFSKLLGKKAICHWVGTDVLLAISKKRYKYLIKSINSFVDMHLAGSETLIEELKNIGIEASLMPLIPKTINVFVKPFPKKFRVLSYIPDERADFYGEPIIDKLAKEFPKVEFLIVGGKGAKEKKPSNIKYLGWKNMASIYPKVNVLLRVPKHDGLSLMVLEALAYGRQVIYSNKFPYCHYCKNYKEIKETLKSIIKNPLVNYEGINYVRKNYNSDKIIQKLITIYKKLLTK